MTEPQDQPADGTAESTPIEQRSPYATGGGGVVLEHEYAAWLLGHLILGDPLPGLGDEFVVTEIAFQARHLSPVDDAVVTGGSATGQRRVLALGVRRDPTIGMSDGKFVELWRSIVAATSAKRDNVRADTLRTGIVVAGPHGPTRQLAALAASARSVGALRSVA